MATKKNVTDAAETAEAGVQETVTDAAMPVDPWKDLVEIQLFKDNGNYKHDVFVAVNGRRFKIKRGEKVKVPRCVAAVLDNSARQDRAAALMVEQLEQEYTE